MKPKIGGLISNKGDLKTELKILKSCGYDYAEFGFRAPKKFIKEYTKNYKEFSKIVPLLAAHMPAITSRKGEVKENKKFISDHLKAGCRNFIFHFFTKELLVEKKVFAKRINDFKELATFAKKQGANFILENTITANVKDLKKVFDKIKGIYFCLDTGHANLSGGKDLSLDYINNFGNKLKHIHAQDNFGGTEIKDDLHLSIGSGNIDFPTIFKKLKEINFSGNITLDVFDFDKKHRQKNIDKIKELLS